jgi:CheY-like chemotaxis protein
MPRILMVDDDEGMRSVIRESLSSSYEIMATSVPETALAKVLELKPDAVLLDLSMPGMSGIELCQALSSLRLTQHIPIFISGDDARNKAYCKNLGAFEYFTKPIDVAKLKADLASALGSKKPERRADLRVPLRVILRLSGTRKDGTFWQDRAATEDVSKGGFLCACASSLEEITTVEVRLCGEPEHYLGHARLVRVERTDPASPRYGFQFVGTAEEANRTLALNL